MLVASLSLVLVLANDGALPPALLVLKNTGSIKSKSPSSLHTLHQDAADHAAPTYETYVHDFIPSSGNFPIFARSDRGGEDEQARRTISVS